MTTIAIYGALAAGFVLGGAAAVYCVRGIIARTQDNAVRIEQLEAAHAAEVAALASEYDRLRRDIDWADERDRQHDARVTEADAREARLDKAGLDLLVDMGRLAEDREAFAAEVEAYHREGQRHRQALTASLAAEPAPFFAAMRPMPVLPAWLDDEEIHRFVGDGYAGPPIEPEPEVDPEPTAPVGPHLVAMRRRVAQALRAAAERMITTSAVLPERELMPV